MTQEFASDKRALGCCDNCGFTYKHRDLQPTSYNSFVCPTCYDGAYDLKNHPQNKPPPTTNDPQAIKNARPDTNDMGPTSATWDPSQTLWIG